MINYIIEKVTPYLQKSYLKRYFDWFVKKLDLQDKAEKLEKIVDIDENYNIININKIFYRISVVVYVL